MSVVCPSRRSWRDRLTVHGAAEEEMTAAREKVRVKLFTVRAAEARLLLAEASGACRGGWRQTWSFRNTTAPMGLHTRLASASCFQKSIDLLLAGEDWAVSYIHTAGGLEPHLEVVARAAPSARPSRRCAGYTFRRTRSGGQARRG